MRVRYDTEVNAASISLTDRLADLPGPVTSVSVKVPENAEGKVILDFKYGRLVGIEVLAADITLPDDLLAEGRP